MRLVVSAKGFNIRLAEKNRVEVPKTSTELGVSLYHTFLVNLLPATLRAPVSATKSTANSKENSRKCVEYCQVGCFARVRRRGDDLATQTSAVSIIAQSDNIASAIAISVAVLYRSVSVCIFRGREA